MKNSITIIAGPCSVDDENLKEIYQISEIKVMDSEGEKLAVYGTRVVGLKSRTGLDATGSGMGMDYEAIMHNINNPEDQKQLPSIELSEKINSDTGMLIASEIMLPHIQMPLYEKAEIPQGKLLAWNPAINQLGWPILETSISAKKNNWTVGLKNPKWLGEKIEIAEAERYFGETSLEKQWKGCVDYASVANHITLIQRGVDVPDKGLFRNALIHKSAMRTKKAVLEKYKDKDIQLYFDPSHSYGPKLRNKIVEGIIEAMKIKINETDYLYDGVLIETGTSKTDTEQHITIDELKYVINELVKFRVINGR